MLLPSRLNDGALPRQHKPWEARLLTSISVSKHELPQDTSEDTAVIVRRRPGLAHYRHSGSTNHPSRWDSFQNLRVWNVKQIVACWAVIDANNRKSLESLHGDAQMSSRPRAASHFTAFLVRRFFHPPPRSFSVECRRHSFVRFLTLSVCDYISLFTVSFISLLCRIPFRPLGKHDPPEPR